MNLAEMLGYADITQLTRIAGTYRCECNGHSKHELIQSILTAVGRKDQFDAQIDSLTIEELRFLHSLLFDTREAFSLEELIARVQASRFDERDTPPNSSKPAADPAEYAETKKTDKRKRKKNAKHEQAEQASEKPGPRETIARFKHYGWLFSGLSGTNRYLFHVPSDLKLRFREAIAKRFAAALEYGGEPEVYRDEQSLLADDVLLLLDYVNKTDIPLTLDGAMYKRSVAQLLEGFAVKEELPARGAWRFGYGRRFKDYPDRMALIYDYCHYKRYLSETNMQLQLTDEGRQKLEARQREELSELYRFWLRLYRAAIPNLPPIVHWIDRLAVRWVTADSLQRIMLPYIRPFYYDDSSAVWHKRIVAMMVHLGLLRLGEDADAGTVLRITNAGRMAIAGLKSGEAEAIALQ